MSACSTCGAPIRWCVTEKGAAMPVDVAPAKNGNLILRAVGSKTIAACVTPLLETPEERAAPHFLSHFATCPSADQHRRKK